MLICAEKKPDDASYEYQYKKDGQNYGKSILELYASLRNDKLATA
jgi:hypothetical protein